MVPERSPLVEIRTQLLSEICMSFIYASYCESMLYIYTYIYIHYPGLNLAYNYK